MRLNAIILLCLYYNSKHSCKFSCLCCLFLFVLSVSWSRLSVWRFPALLVPCFCFSVVFAFGFVFALCVCDCFCAVFGQCRTPKTAQRAKHSREPARGTPPPILSCLLACLCYRCIIYHYARTYAAGVYRPAPGGTFLVRFTGKNQPNRSCSSSQPIVRKAIHSLPR